jgi:hypothetical protein
VSWEKLCRLVVESLSDDLLSPEWRKYKREHPDKHETFGHCYVVSEALYHMLGGKEEGWTPQHVKVQGVPHWFLKHKSGAKLDVTAAQFKVAIPYDKARGTGFLTKEPSKRAKELISRIRLGEGWL